MWENIRSNTLNNTLNKLTIANFFGEDAQIWKADEELDEINEAFEIYSKNPTLENLTKLINEVNDLLNVLEGLAIQKGINMSDTRKILKNGIKPPLVFTCKLCNTEWEHEDWRVEEDRNKIFNHVLIGYTTQKVELPTSKCPVCGWTSQNSKTQKEYKEEVLNVR